MKKFNLLTIFPEIFDSFFRHGVIARGIDSGIIGLNIVNIRDYAYDKHKMTDDYQYGGGQGLVMKPEPVCEAVYSIKKLQNTRVVLLDPRGERFDQAKAEELSRCESISLICGRYEGVDERIREQVVDEEISLGDFILTGGEAAAMVIVDAVSRLVPGVLGDERSSEEESFTNGLLEFPHYTRPYEYNGYRVPDILRSGDHKKIEKWRKKQSLKITLQNRKDLLKDKALDSEAKDIIKELRAEMVSGASLYLALLHYPMLDKHGDNVATAITNMDLHDISRSCKTFGVKKYFVVTPLDAQREIAGRVLNHWMEGYGATYNGNRKEAFSGTKIKNSLLETVSEIEDIEGRKPVLVATSAKKCDNNVSYKNVADMLSSSPILLLLGTGWGMSGDIINEADYIAEPINGAGDFNHLSVRSAAAIILDRISCFIQEEGL